MAERALRALEYAHSELDNMGWPSPLNDGALGGGPEFDLYLVPTDTPAAAHSDGVSWWTYLDRASTFAVLSPNIPAEAVDACIAATYAEALLMSMDPAEARQWRRATAAWLSWELTGQFGCEDAVSDQQTEPERGWVRGGVADGAGGALFLAYLSARHGGPAFVRDAWELSSQRTWEGEGLRAEPDLWAAIETSVKESGDRLLSNIEELAVLRWFIGRGKTENAFVASIDGDARAIAARELNRIPTRTTARRPLEPFGSAYVILNENAWKPNTRIRAWMTGEYGVRWSFVAIQLDAVGNELHRSTAPSTGTSPTAYLPIEIDPETRQILLVVTNLSSRLPDADEPDVYERAFRLTLDAGDESERSD
jgi:hypothetical protein